VPYHTKTVGIKQTQCIWKNALRARGNKHMSKKRHVEYKGNVIKSIETKTGFRVEVVTGGKKEFNGSTLVPRVRINQLTKNETGEYTPVGLSLLIPINTVSELIGELDGVRKYYPHFRELSV